MNNLSQLPYNWVKEISPKMFELNQIPLLGSPPDFPWKTFSELISKFFNLSDVEIHPTEIRIRSNEELYHGFAKEHMNLFITINALDGNITWVLNDKDINFIMHQLIGQTPTEKATVFVDKDFQQGFYTYFALEVFNLFDKLEFDKTLSFQLQEDSTAPSGTLLTLDIQITLANRSFLGRLILSEAFIKAWREYYAQKKLSSTLSKKLSEKIQIPLRIECGKVSLTQEEWSQINIGDFIVLDYVSLSKEDGEVLLKFNDHPLFRAKLKEGSLEILQPPSYQPPIYEEAMTTMDKNPPHDEELPESAHESYDESFSHEEEESEFKEESLDKKEEEEEEEFSEEEVEKISQELTSKAKKANNEKKEKEQAVLSKDVTKDELVHVSELPVTLTIEVGKVQLPISKIIELQSGNILDLHIKPEDGVDLMVNGKCIGKGELLKMGETLGVRILDLG